MNVALWETSSLSSMHGGCSWITNNASLYILFFGV